MSATWVPEHGVSCIVLGDGAEWRQQCGGYSCRQETANGGLVLIANDDVSNKLTDYFCGDKWNGWCTSGIDEETASFIESVLPSGSKFVVSRARFEDGCEAWVHGHLDGLPAVLVWQNSD